MDFDILGKRKIQTVQRKAKQGFREITFPRTNTNFYTEVSISSIRFMDSNVYKSLEKAIKK